jgi:glycosyltransferase involved in cell wall biosynthesis
MRILHLTPSLSGGGAERQLGYLAPELARMGHDVHIAYSREGSHTPELPDVALHRVNSRSNYNPYLLWRLVRLVRHIRPDVIHTWILQMDILGGVAASINGIPWILREPSSAMAYPPTWKHRMRVQVGSRANAVVSNSFGGDEYWKTRLPFSRRCVIRNGLPLHEIDRIAAALPLGLPKHEAPIVLFVGRLTEDGSAAKSLKALLEALASVRRERNLSGIFCGEGPHRSELEGLRNRLGLDADVRFTGHLPAASVWGLMKMAAVFVSLSAYEGCPNTVMEAVACGCPLVISDIPAHRELLDEETALFVDLDRPEQIAAELRRVLATPDDARRRACAARGRAADWSVASMAARYEKLYREVFDRTRVSREGRGRCAE